MELTFLFALLSARAGFGVVHVVSGVDRNRTLDLLVRFYLVGFIF